MLLCCLIICLSHRCSGVQSKGAHIRPSGARLQEASPEMDEPTGGRKGDDEEAVDQAFGFRLCQEVRYRPSESGAATATTAATFEIDGESESLAAHQAFSRRRERNRTQGEKTFGRQRKTGQKRLLAKLSTISPKDIQQIRRRRFLLLLLLPQQ